MGGSCSTMRERRGIYRVLVGQLRGRDPGIEGRIII
jgi:hypothetical protein